MTLDLSRGRTGARNKPKSHRLAVPPIVFSVPVSIHSSILKASLSGPCKMMLFFSGSSLALLDNSSEVQQLSCGVLFFLGSKVAWEPK